MTTDQLPDGPDIIAAIRKLNKHQPDPKDANHIRMSPGTLAWLKLTVPTDNVLYEHNRIQAFGLPVLADTDLPDNVIVRVANDGTETVILLQTKNES